MGKIPARDRLIFALDVPSAAEAERLLDRLQGHISFVKIGLELYTAAGPDMIKRVLDRNMRVFLDLKFLDIEETVRRATARVAAMGGNGVAADGLYVGANADGSAIRGLVIRDFGINNGDVGVEIDPGATNVTVAGNYIGALSHTGTYLAGEDNYDGGIMLNGANNVVGGLTAADRNIVVGNGSDEISILGDGADNNVVRGNYIGVISNPTFAAVPEIVGREGHGILMLFGPDGTSIIGNVIGGNSLGGVRMIDLGNQTLNTTIQGNWIGTDPTGTINLGNGLEGIAIQHGPDNVLVGGTALA